MDNKLINMSLIKNLFVASCLLFYWAPVVGFVAIKWASMALESAYMPAWGTWFMWFTFLSIASICLYQAYKGRPVSWQNTTLPIIAPSVYVLLTIGYLEFWAAPSDLNPHEHFDTLLAEAASMLGWLSLLLAWVLGVFFSAFSKIERT